MKTYTILQIISFFIVFCFTLCAEEVDIKSIVRDADSLLETGIVYSVSELTVFDSGKEKPTMKVEGYSMMADGITYSLTIYRAPAKMKGTAYLMIGNDMWIKFGNTGRTRKLSSSAKKNSAGGTDFSYNDMSENDTGLSEKYNVSLVDENIKVDDQDCYKVLFTADAGSDAPYKQLVAYITHNEKRYIKIEYYENNANIKTMFLTEWKEIEGREYPFLVTMKSHTKSSYTEYRIISMEFDSPKVKKNMFNQTYLGQIK